MKLTARIYHLLLRLYRMLPFKKHICLLIRFIGIPSEKFYRDLTFYGKFKIKTGNKSIRLFHYNTTIENELFWKGIDHGWEKVSLSLWMKLVGNASVIIDLGANTGIYALIAAKLNAAAKIYAFEPSAKTIDKLNQNIQLNSFSNIKVMAVAVSNRNGQATFYDFKTDHLYSASLNNDMVSQHPSKIETKVPVITLDDFILHEKLSAIDVIKIDVEMHEAEVLEGFKKHLQLFRPTLLIEILTDEIGSRIESQLCGLGYLFFNIDEVHQPFAVMHLSKSACYNFLICQPAVAHELQLI